MNLGEKSFPQILIYMENTDVLTLEEHSNIEVEEKRVDGQENWWTRIRRRRILLPFPSSCSRKPEGSDQGMTFFNKDCEV